MKDSANSVDVFGETPSASVLKPMMEFNGVRSSCVMLKKKPAAPATSGSPP